MLTVACYLWTDPSPHQYGSFRYGPEHVWRLREGVGKHLSIPHEFVCLTYQPKVFDPQWREDHRLEYDGIIPIKLDLSTHIPGTEFVKLMTFHPKGKEMIGERVLQLDLDTIICGSLDPIVDRTEDLVVWRNPTRIPYDNPVMKGRPFYNGSVILYTPGTRSEVWQAFEPGVAGIYGGPFPTTQEWMSHIIGPNMPYWDGSDGIYRLARKDTPGSGIWGELPANARIVNFVGSEHKPNNPAVRAANPWIADYWPEVLA